MRTTEARRPSCCASRPRTQLRAAGARASDDREDDFVLLADAFVPDGTRPSWQSCDRRRSLRGSNQPTRDTVAQAFANGLSFDAASGRITLSTQSPTPPEKPVFIVKLEATQTLTIQLSCGQFDATTKSEAWNGHACPAAK